MSWGRRDGGSCPELCFQMVGGVVICEIRTECRLIGIKNESGTMNAEVTEGAVPLCMIQRQLIAPSLSRQ